MVLAGPAARHERAVQIPLSEDLSRFLRRSRNHLYRQLRAQRACMSSNPASYDQGHTTFLEPSRQQAWLMLGRLHFTYGADGPIGQIDIKQQESLAMSKVFV
jgi:hypothetical protein